jgi:hypothetical protein
LQAAILFAQEIGTFSALTAWTLLNSISQFWHDIKFVKISAVDLGTMLFLLISIKKIPNLVTLSLESVKAKRLELLESNIN